MVGIENQVLKSMSRHISKELIKVIRYIIDYNLVNSYHIYFLLQGQNEDDICNATMKDFDNDIDQDACGDYGDVGTRFRILK